MCERRTSQIFFVLLLSISVVYIDARQDANYLKDLKTHVNLATPRTLDLAVPQNYNIKLSLPRYGNELVINGESIITLDISKSTNYISFYYVGLIKQALLYHNLDFVMSNGIQIKCTGLTNLTFEKQITPGIYKLYIEYISRPPIQANSMFAIPVVFFKNKILTNDWFLVTNFQPNGARYIFPCWDKPEIKATFKLTLMYHPSYTAYSSMLSKIITIRNNSIFQIFEQTPQMSAYHVTIAIIPVHLSYGYLHISDMNNLLHRTEIKSQVQRIPQVIVNVTTMLSLYAKTNINGYFEKSHILIPNMRMEVVSSLGLMIYRENAIAYDYELDSIMQKIEAMRLITRVLVNSWFNSMVSPCSWSSLWFHEGLGIFLQTKIDLNQDHRINELVIVQTRHESLYMDVFSHMIALEDIEYFDVCIYDPDGYEDTEMPEDNEQLYSYFALYVKAPIILYMLENIVTPDVFQTGVVQYFNKYNLKCATSDNLWEEMESVLNHSDVTRTNYTLKVVMNMWITEQNYPIVKVEQYYNEIVVFVETLKFTNRNSASLNQNWWIPIIFTTQTQLNFSNTVPQAWLNPDNLIITLDAISENDWIIVNVQQIGYYRVQYDEWNWKLIADYLNSADYINIPSLTRAQIIDDAYFFMMAGQLNFNIFTHLTNYLSKETDYVAWYPMLKIFEYLSRFLPFEESEVLKIHMSTIVTGVLNKLTYKDNANEHDLIKCLRQELAKWACILDDFECKKAAYIKLKNHLNYFNSYKLLPSWKPWSFCNGLNVASRITWLKFWDRYATLLSHNTVLQLLSCSRAFTNHNFQYDMHLTLKLTNSQHECISILYYAVMMNTEADLHDTLNNFKDHIFYCKVAPFDIVKVLSVIINHLYSKYAFLMVEKFVKKDIKFIPEEIIENAITERKYNIERHRRTFNVLCKKNFSIWTMHKN